MTKWQKIKLSLFIAAAVLAAGIGIWYLFGKTEHGYHFYEGVPAAKPVIYLYPGSEMQVEVSLGLDGEFTSTWPPYEDGWTVTALPDGTLYKDGEEYYCLFWEGDLQYTPDLSEGFCVPGEETGEFLQDILAQMGMTPREANEMILYWLPQMENNAYNVISFQRENYDSAAKLHITPQPDSVLRVMMAWKPSDKYVSLPPQAVEPFEREGFTVVEWGGAKLD